MKIYILFKNNEDDLSTLPADAEKRYVFQYIKGPPNIEHIQKRLIDVLDEADTVNDRIVFNGPSYLTAIAGYVWFGNTERKTTNFFAFSIKDNAYVEHTEEINV